MLYDDQLAAVCPNFSVWELRVASLRPLPREDRRAAPGSAQMLKRKPKKHWREMYKSGKNFHERI